MQGSASNGSPAGIWHSKKLQGEEKVCVLQDVITDEIMPD